MIAAITLAVLLSIHSTNSATPTNPDTLALYEDPELKQGRVAYTAGDYQIAVEILKPYVEKKPKSFDGHLYLGLSYRELKRFDEAVIALEKASAMEPKTAQVHLELGQTYLLVKNYYAVNREYQWLKQQVKDSWMADLFRLSIPAEVAHQYQLPPSPLEKVKADLAAAQPMLPMTEDLRPVISYREKAKYTEDARKKNIAGAVVLRVVFSKQAKLIVVEVLCGLPDGLTESAIEAAQKIRFTPPQKGRQPVSVIGSVEFNFPPY